MLRTGNFVWDFWLIDNILDIEVHICHRYIPNLTLMKRYFNIYNYNPQNVRFSPRKYVFFPLWPSALLRPRLGGEKQSLVRVMHVPANRIIYNI